MNELMEYRFGKMDIRTMEINGEPWFVLKDVCTVLGLSDISKTAERLDPDELTRTKFVSGGQEREMYIINESGLYNVILRSDKPEAKDFRRWITHEVLPSIRKNGFYSMFDSEETVNEKIIPALRRSEIDPGRFIMEYLGMEFDEFFKDNRLVKKVLEHREAKERITMWRKNNLGVYTADDMPEQYRGDFLFEAIKKVRNKQDCYGMFQNYCKKVYFNINGLAYIVDCYIRKGEISEREGQEWINSLHTQDALAMERKMRAKMLEGDAGNVVVLAK